MTRPQTDRSHVASCDNCGWRSSKPTTEGLARHARQMHRCSRHRANVERAQRVAARKNATGPIRACTHKVANHQHGTYAAYVLDRCRCKPCRKANSDYEANRVRTKLYGRPENLVDAQPARDHITWLALNNVGLKRIAKVAGVSQGGLWKLMYGKRRPNGTRVPSKRIRRDVAERILAVQPTIDTLADGAMIDATGTQRRLQALVAFGYSMSSLGRHIGWTPANFCPLVTDAGVIRVFTARKVRDLYDQLWNVAPPNDTHREKISVARAKNFAAARGWVPPLAWDDDTIDDPCAQPTITVLQPTVDDDIDQVAIDRYLAGERLDLTKAERAAVVAQLAAEGLDAAAIAHRMRTSKAVIRPLMPTEAIAS